MGVEIERKFLVNADKWVNENKDDKKLIEQGYILNDGEKTVRVRIYGDKGFITIKGSRKGISRAEFEFEIPVADAEALIKNFCNATVKKIRHKVLFHSKVWEVDEFLDENKGLLMAEIELKSDDEQFELPGWADKEVTHDRRYYNGYLSTNPFSKW
jgi:CYTH domain-containing protein